MNISNSVGQISEFAEIFFRYGFNSQVFYVATNESQNILEDKRLFHILTFRLENDYWNKETVCIQYIRPNKTNNTDMDEFLEKSLQVSKDGVPRRDENANIQTLAIGKRENAYYIRIYKMDSALKFELEIKKRPAQHLGLLLVKGSCQEFENYIPKSFVKRFWKSIFLETYFIDWLNYFLRAHFNEPKKYWVTFYLQKYFLIQTTEEPTYIYMSAHESLSAF